MIRPFIYSLCAVVVAVSAQGKPLPKATEEEKLKVELVRLEGTWKVVSCVRDGVETPAEVLALMSKVTFKGYGYTFSDGGGGKILAVDPANEPKTISYLNDGNDEKEGIQNGIYKLDGDTFMDCVAIGEKPRPKEFASKKGSGLILMKYKRVKEKSE